MKEIKHEVITQGTPKLENMTKEVFNVFCKSILDIIKEEKGKEKSLQQKTSDKKWRNYYVLLYYETLEFRCVIQAFW